MKDLTAKKVVEYFEIYKEYLSDNKLADDSKTIKVMDMVRFVDDHILNDGN